MTAGKKKIRFLSGPVIYCPLHSRKGELCSAFHETLAREWKQRKDTTERWPNNTAFKEYREQRLTGWIKITCSLCRLVLPTKLEVLQNWADIGGWEVQSNYPYFRIRKGPRARNNQGLPWEAPSRQGRQGEHPTEPWQASAPSPLSRGAEHHRGKSLGHWWQVRRSPLAPCA